MSTTPKESRLTSDGIIKKRKRGPRDYRAENARRYAAVVAKSAPGLACSRDMLWKVGTINRILDSGIITPESAAEIRRLLSRGGSGNPNPDGTVKPQLSINAAFKMLRGFEAKALLESVGISMEDNA